MSWTWTEGIIQSLVADRVTQPSDLAMVPNCGALGHEADLLRVTKTRDVFEYEVKVSKADYRRDSGKNHIVSLNSGIDFYGGSGGFYKRGLLRLPHRFYYAVPAGLLDGEEVPAWAGVIEFERNEAGNFRMATPKRGRRLHGLALPERTFDYILRGQCLRYWQLRKNSPGVQP